MVEESVGTIGKSHFIHDLEQVCQTSGIQGLHLQNFKKKFFFALKKSTYIHTHNVVKENRIASNTLTERKTG